MALTLLGGIARGIALDVPKGDGVRPTSVMLRRKIFDAHQDLDQHIFIDLCAGTGAIGLEAWSRGASQVYLIEAEAKTHRVLGQNVKKLMLKHQDEIDERQIVTRQAKALNWLNQFRREYLNWDELKQENTIIFLDPPYDKKDLYQDIASFALREWFVGRLWIESDRQKGLPSEFWDSWGDQFVKTYFQGTSYVAVLDLRQGLG